MVNEKLPGKAAQEKMAGRIIPMPAKMPDNAKLAAVLILIFELNESPQILLIKRKIDGKEHSGQIAFPGGAKDTSDFDLKETAQREAHEEVGIAYSDYTILFQLTPLYIPVSNYLVQPYLALYNKKSLDFIINPDEVDEIVFLPIDDLLSQNTKTKKTVLLKNKRSIEVPAYQLKNNIVIWGATAMILSELETMIKNRS